MNASVTNGVTPLSVQFSSEGSRDPDPGDSIRFAWDFDGDGTVDSTDPNPTYVYRTNGVYTAKLTVTDSAEKTDTKTLQIVVGNTAPTIEITTPLEGDFFEWGDQIPFTVKASDPEDGPIDCSKVVVTFVLVHDTHGHAEEAKTGCSGTLQTLAEDASHGGYIAGGISATYTDSGANGQPALSATDQHVVQVRKQQVEYVQENDGTAVTASTETDAGRRPGAQQPRRRRLVRAQPQREPDPHGQADQHPICRSGGVPADHPGHAGRHGPGRRGGPRRQPDGPDPDQGPAQVHG